MSEQEKNQSCSAESCSSCAQAGSCPSKKVDMRVPANQYTNVKKVIGVISGKGGVGKSMVTASLARLMRAKVYSEGILDADITGPSIPKMYGVHDHAMGADEGMFPCIAQDETRIMSINLLLDSEDTPVIWRGPVIAGVVTQFWNEVLWGDLDYLFIDMPPGTGDVSLTTFQSIPLDGLVMVTTPQDLVSLIVKKSINMAEAMNIPLLGICENMSYLVCPNCDEKIYIYGNKDSKEFKEKYHYERIGQIPFDGDLTKLVDEGRIEEFDKDYVDEIVDMIQNMGDVKNG